MRTEEIKGRLTKLSIVEKTYPHENMHISDKNIGIFVHTLTEGGSQRAVEALIQRLIGLDFGVFIFSPVDGKYGAKYSKEYGALVLITSEDTLCGQDRKTFESFDVVFINSFCSYRYAYYFVNTKVPCFIWAHEGERITRNYINAIDPIVVSSANFIHAFPWTKPMKLWKNAYPFAETAYLPIAVKDTDRIDINGQDNAASHTGVRFFIPGSYQVHKGFHIAIQSFMMLESVGVMDFKAIFCGYENSGDYYNTLVNACSGHAYIELRGELTKSEMDEEYCKADCIVVPSLFDAGPLTAVEALVHGKLLVVSDAAGVSDILQDCYSGFVFKSENVEELYKRLLLIYHDRESCKSIAERGRAIYEQYFTDAAMDDALNKLLEHCID